MLRSIEQLDFWLAYENEPKETSIPLHDDSSKLRTQAGVVDMGRLDMCVSPIMPYLKV